jgi:hypothetical protein
MSGEKGINPLLLFRNLEKMLATKKVDTFHDMMYNPLSYCESSFILNEFSVYLS